MDCLALSATLHARPGKESEVEEVLKSAQPLAEREPGTKGWYAFKIGSSIFGIFDTFADENGRDAHRGGAIARALLAKAEELFAIPPEIEKLDILVTKTVSA